MLRGCVYMEGAVLKLSQELDEAINEYEKYIKENNITLEEREPKLEDIEVKRERLHKALGPKLKQDEIDQIFENGGMGK